MSGYGWDRYDPRRGGVQTMHDTGNQIDLTTSFIKLPDSLAAGGNWAVRVRGKPRADAPASLKTTVVFAVAAPSSGLTGLEVAGAADEVEDPRGIQGDVTIKGESPSLGGFRVVITEGEGRRPEVLHPSGAERPLDRAFVQSTQLAENLLWQSKRGFGRCMLAWRLTGGSFGF
jgi:mannosyl-oligosaccharide glucosidase